MITGIFSFTRFTVSKKEMWIKDLRWNLPVHVVNAEISIVLEHRCKDLDGSGKAGGVNGSVAAQAANVGVSADVQEGRSYSAPASVSGHEQRSLAHHVE